jgi:DNA repair protein SbcD/Mre11
MPRFLHAADLHLDSPLQRLESYEGAPVEEIRSATRVALRNLVDLAMDQQVDLVVIAGDLYDGDWRDHNTGLFFVQQISRLTRENIPVLAISGNHDAANQMTRSLPLPKNPDGSAIMLSSQQAESRRFESLGIAVHGRSFRTRAEMDNLAIDYPAADGGMFNIGLLHTSLTGAEGHEPYAPCTPQQLAEKHYDYWALGHIHTRGERQVEGAAPVVFSGNIQGRHTRELGPKGCVLVEIDSSGKSTRTFHPLDTVRWEVFRLDATRFHQADELTDAYRDWLSDQIEAAEQRTLVTRVRVAGMTDLHDQLMHQREHWENALRAIALDVGAGRVWLESLRLRTERPARSVASFDPDGPLASLDTVLGELLDDDDSVAAILAALDPLAKKLPDEWKPPATDALAFHDQQTLVELVEAARPLLHTQLREEEGS